MPLPKIVKPPATPTGQLEFQRSSQHPSSGDTMAFEIRKIRASRGRKQLVREREESFRLMDQA